MTKQFIPVWKPHLPAQPGTGSSLQNGLSRKRSAPCVGNISCLDRSRWEVHVLLCQKYLSFSRFPVPCILGYQACSSRCQLKGKCQTQKARSFITTQTIIICSLGLISWTRKEEKWVRWVWVTSKNMPFRGYETTLIFQYQKCWLRTNKSENSARWELGQKQGNWELTRE